MLQWDPVGRAQLGAAEPAQLAGAAKGWMMKLEVFLPRGMGSGRPTWLIPAVVAVFIRLFRYRNVK